MAHSPLDLFTHTAQCAANEVIDSYSTSFGAATRLLGRRHRQHIINFLRDLADDTHRLRRSYLAPTPRLTSNQRDEWLERIKQRLGAAEKAMPLLPTDARGAVKCATDLFAALAKRLAAAEIADLYQRRLRVSGGAKAAIIGRALLRSRRA